VPEARFLVAGRGGGLGRQAALVVGPEGQRLHGGVEIAGAGACVAGFDAARGLVFFGTESDTVASYTVCGDGALRPAGSGAAGGRVIAILCAKCLVVLGADNVTCFAAPAEAPAARVYRKNDVFLFGIAPAAPLVAFLSQGFGSERRGDGPR